MTTNLNISIDPLEIGDIFVLSPSSWTKKKNTSRKCHNKRKNVDYYFFFIWSSTKHCINTYLCYFAFSQSTVFNKMYELHEFLDNMIRICPTLYLLCVFISHQKYYFVHLLFFLFSFDMWYFVHLLSVVIWCVLIFGALVLEWEFALSKTICIFNRLITKIAIFFLLS